MTPETWAEQLRRAGKILGLLGDDIERSSLPNGEFYERRFQYAVKLLVTEGIIRGFTKTVPNSADDGKGIDYYLQLAEEIEVPFQVTSTLDHCRARKRNHPNIPVIYGRVAGMLFDKEYLARKILKLAGEYLLESAFLDIQLRCHRLTWQRIKPILPEETIYDVICEGESRQIHLVGSNTSLRRIIKDNPGAIIVKPLNKKGWKSIPQIKTEVESALGLSRGALFRQKANFEPRIQGNR